MFLYKEMKTCVLDICLFLLFAKTIPQKLERFSNYQCLKQNTSDFWLFFLNITIKISAGILSYGQL